MSNNKKEFLLNLQLFAEGAAAGASEGTGESEGMAENGEIANSEGSNAQAPGAQEQKLERNLEKEFDELISGDYKDIYNSKMQKTVQSRLKNSKKQIQQLEGYMPLVNLISEKYGADAQDVNSLIDAVQKDEAYYREEALENGISVEQLKEIKRVKAENAAYKNAEMQRKENEFIDNIVSQAEEMKEFYPNFDIMSELEDPIFKEMVSNNVPVKKAYEVQHLDEINSQMLDYSQKKAEKKISDNIAANGKRPNENGLGSNSAVNVKKDISKMSDKTYDEIMEKLRAGEPVNLEEYL